MEEKRKAFITGATSINYPIVKKKLEYLGYEVVGPEESYFQAFEDAKISRLEKMLSCDDLFFCDNMTGRRKDIRDMEKEIARYLEMTIYSEEELNRMVADKAVGEFEKENLYENH